MASLKEKQKVNSLVFEHRKHEMNENTVAINRTKEISSVSWIPCSRNVHRSLNKKVNYMEIVYKNESYAINGAAFEVYKQLGHGFLEAVYQEAFEIELRKRNIPFEREKELTIFYDGQALRQSYRADFVCFGKIIVEMKAVSGLDDSHRAQVYNYLKATGYKLGLLYNFGHYDGLEFERKIK